MEKRYYKLITLDSAFKWWQWVKRFSLKTEKGLFIPKRGDYEEWSSGSYEVSEFKGFLSFITEKGYQVF